MRSYATLNPREFGCDYLFLTQVFMEIYLKLLVALEMCFADTMVVETPEIKRTSRR